MTSLYNASAAAKARKEQPCRCKGWPFPHRQFSKGCLANEPGPFCGHCGQPCEAHAVDNGIGAYEYWGSKSVDTRIDIESKCCDAPCFENAELTINYEGEDE